MTGEDGDRNHCTAAQNVEKNADECKERLSTKAAGEEHSEDGVEHDTARHAGHGLLPCGNALIAISLDGQEVAVDAENDARAAEFESVHNRRDDAKDGASNSHCDVSVECINKNNKGEEMVRSGQVERL